MRIKGHCKSGRDFMAWDEVEISDVHCAHVGHRIVNISLEWCEGDVVRASICEASNTPPYCGRIENSCWVTNLDIEINDLRPFRVSAHNVDPISGKNTYRDSNIPLQDVIKEEPQEFKLID